jgi:Cu+-exporting ATPase
MSLRREARGQTPVTGCCSPRSAETRGSCCAPANTTDSRAIDPICGMEVERSAPAGGAAEVDGETYYFCSTFCRARFVESRSPQG